MLRKNAEPKPAGVPFPDSAIPFCTGPLPRGVHFYRGRTARFFSYAVLGEMRCDATTLVVRYAETWVTLEGHGLHTLYRLLAEQRLDSVHEAEAESTDAPIRVDRITFAPTAPDSNA